MTETTELYNGEVLCEFNEARHSYTILVKGRRYKVPSVTRICSIIDKSGPLMGWAINNTLDVCKGAIAPGCEYAETYLEAVWDAAKKQSRAVKDSAADKGKQEHRCIEDCFRRGDFGQVSSGELPSGAAWFQSLGGKALCFERRIYSRRNRYSGTFDLLADINGVLVLIDWKTGRSIYPEFRLQTAAYCKAYEEEFPDKRIEGRYLVRIAEDGSVEPHYFPRSTLRKDFAAFLGAKTLFDRVQQIDKENRKSLKLKA